MQDSNVLESRGPRTDKRLNLVLPGSTYSEVYTLSKASKKSMTELVRLGLGLAKIALEESRKGNKIIVATPDGQALKELVLPY